MTDYTYSRIAALNFNTTPPTVARSATGSVYAIADTTFTTPLNITMVVGGFVTTSLSADANGFFPDFKVANRTSVVWKQASSSFTTVLTTSDPVPGPPGTPGTPGTQGVKGDRGDLATWQASTFYPLNQVIANPSGDLVKVTTAHTSGASYDATKFGWVNNNAANLTGTLPEASVPARLAEASLNATIATAVAPKLDSTTAATTYAPISGSANYAKPRKARLVGFGHSLMYYNFGDAAWQPLRPHPASRGQLMQANSMLGHRFDWINRGVGGEDTGAWLARLTTDLVNVDAGYAAISGPTNDVTNIDGGSRTVAQTKSAYNQIWDACATSGKFIFQETAPPRDGATTNQKNLRSELNNWLRSQQGVRKDFVIVDIERATMDPVTNAFVAGYSWDGVHFATPGAIAGGAEYARKMAIVIPERQITLPAADTRNLLKNNGGAFIGTATAVPTGWNVVGATGTDPTYDRVAFTDRPGQKLKIVMPNGSIRFYRSTTLQQDLGEFAPGDVVRFSVAYEATNLDTAPGAITQAIYATLERNGTNVAIDLEWSADANPNGVPGTQNENMGSMPRSGVLRTTAYTIPAGSSQTLAATFQVRGGGTYHFWNPTIEKVSA